MSTSAPGYGILCFCIFLLAGCEGKQEAPAAPRVPLSLETLMILTGGDGEGDGASFLSAVSRLTTDSAGNIFIYDGRSHRVLKFRADGMFITSFGREGSGPGEFQRVYCIQADRNGGLVVADNGNARISVYDAEGNLLLNESQHGIQSIRDITEMTDGRFIVAGWHPENEKLLHIMSPDFSRIETSLVDLDEISGIDSERLAVLVKSLAGSSELLGPDKIAFTPAFYGGKLFVYGKNEADEWEQQSVRRGFETVASPLKITSGSVRSVLENVPPSSILSVGSREGTVSAIHVISRSFGLYPTEEGDLVHLSYYYADNEIIFVAEKFEGNTGDLRHFGIEVMGRESTLRPLSMNPAGKIYLRRTDTVAVRIMGTGERF